MNTPITQQQIDDCVLTAKDAIEMIGNGDHRTPEQRRADRIEEIRGKISSLESELEELEKPACPYVDSTDMSKTGPNWLEKWGHR